MGWRMLSPSHACPVPFANFLCLTETFPTNVNYDLLLLLVAVGFKNHDHQSGSQLAEC